MSADLSLTHPSQDGEIQARRSSFYIINQNPKQKSVFVNVILTITITLIGFNQGWFISIYGVISDAYFSKTKIEDKTIIDSRIGWINFCYSIGLAIGA